jgi:hypothetical protein
LILDPTLILTAQGLDADPWQAELLRGAGAADCEPHVLLNCSRQSGKSTTVAALALHQALVAPSLVLLVAPAERQSHELLRKVLAAYKALGQPVESVRRNRGVLELANGSRIVALPGREQTIRSFSGVRLLILDEAARVPDVLYRSLRPMLAVSRGRLVALSTPFGQQGWFFHEWSGQGPWQRIRITWKDCPRIDPAFIADEVRAMGQAWVDQEYNCLFTALEGLVYADFERALVPGQALPPGRAVGGIDFGWRNPFAAVWGVLDRDDVLWIGHERYLSQTPLGEHAAALPREVMWYADPSGRTEIEELRGGGLTVRRGRNDIRAGIAAVTARLRTGRLKVLPDCPQLAAEARLYRYPTPAERAVLGENPIDAHNHALAALRYLVSRLSAPSPRKPEVARPPTPPAWDEDQLWTPVG